MVKYYEEDIEKTDHHHHHHYDYYRLYRSFWMLINNNNHQQQICRTTWLQNWNFQEKVQSKLISKKKFVVNFLAICAHGINQKRNENSMVIWKNKRKKRKKLLWSLWLINMVFWLSRNDRNEKLISKCRENSGSTKIFDTSTVKLRKIDAHAILFLMEHSTFNLSKKEIRIGKVREREWESVKIAILQSNKY